MLTSASFILKAWKYELRKNVSPQGFRMFLVHGELGIGKSAYAFKTGVEVLAELCGYSQEQAWDAVKEFLVFTPEQFLEKLNQIERRIPFLIWDDAGLWLFAFDYKDPLLERIIKMLNTLRSKIAGLMLTTPVPEMVLKRIRVFPGTFEVPIISNARKEHPWGRIAKGYGKVRLPDGRHFSRLVYEDRFSCRMPDSFFAWYEPIRREYQEIAEDLLKEEWEKIKRRSKVLKKLKEYKNISGLPPLSYHPFIS